MKYNKKSLFGGDNNILLNSNKQAQIFLSIIIIGYFGVKIVYGLFFNFYPEKYYYRNIEVTTNEGGSNSTTQDITLNAYIPGMWNNEMGDFIMLLVLSYVIYIYTNVSGKSFIDINGNLNLSFLFGYIIGLGYPPIYSNYISLFNKEFNSSPILKYIYLVVALGFIMFVVIMNYNSLNQLESVHKTNYTIYWVVIILMLFGLLVSKKNSKNYSSVTYFNNNGESCSFSKNGVIQTSGDLIKITIPFATFVILLLFSYEPNEMTMKNLYTFVYGLLLGILVSSISYYGIEYFLQKEPMKECTSLNECLLKDMPRPLEDKNDTSLLRNIASNNIDVANIDANIKDNPKIDTIMNVKSKVSMVKIALIIFIILISIYLIYFYFKK